MLPPSMPHWLTLCRHALDQKMKGEQGKEDDKEMDCSDMEEESGEVTDTKDWVDENGYLGPEDGEADEEEVVDNHYMLC